MVKIEAPLLTTYFVRHQESVQNKQGFGPSDTDLTEEGKQNVRDIVKLFNHVGVDNIDYIFCGDLKRHDQTLNALLDQIDFKGHIRFDEKLNAFFNHPMLEGDPEKTEKEYDLARFKRGDNGLYEIRLSDNKTLGFDPQGTGVYPFDPLYPGRILIRI